jgi:hypothetical protein
MRTGCDKHINKKERKKIPSAYVAVPATNAVLPTRKLQL